MTVPVTTPAVVSIAQVRALTTAVKKASKAVAGRPSVPCLSGLRLSSLSNGFLQVSGFDYETAISVRVPVADGGPLESDVLVPAAMFRTVLENLDQNDGVALSIYDNTLYLNQTPKRVKLKLMKLEDYPSLPKVPRGRSFTVSGRQLDFIGTHVTPFCAREKMLPTLMATRLELSDDGRLSAMATDRYRAAIADVKVRMARTREPVSALVPRMALVGSLLKGAKTVAVTFGPDRTTHNAPHIHFHTDEVTVSLYLLVEGDYPRLRGVWPPEFDVSATVEPVALLKSLKLVSAGLERNEPVHVVLGNSRVELAGRSGEDEVGDEVEATTSGELTTAFNPDYLGQVVKVFGTKGQVKIEANERRRPAQFTNSAVPGLRVLLMPMKTQQ